MEEGTWISISTAGGLAAGVERDGGGSEDFCGGAV